MNNIYATLPDAFHGEVFDSLLESRNVTIQRIVSRGHASPESGWYDQVKNEWVMVLRGSASIAYPDKVSVTLREGDYINIEAHEKHRVEWTDPEVQTVWLAVHYES
ncbi:MAG: cupin domain-containing protein [Halioglobus sp.]